MGYDTPAPQKPKIARKSITVRCKAVLPGQKGGQTTKRPQGILCVLARSLRMYGRSFCPSKPCVSLSIEGNINKKRHRMICSCGVVQYVKKASQSFRVRRRESCIYGLICCPETSSRSSRPRPSAPRAADSGSDADSPRSCRRGQAPSAYPAARADTAPKTLP